MARAALLPLVVLVASFVACDSASENEGCVDPNDPSKPGSNPANCPRSVFPAQDFRARDVAGVVRRGEDPVVGAGVRVTPAIGSPASPVDTNTDVAGFFRSGAAPSLYDLTFKLPNGANGRDDLLVYRGVANRYLEPQLDLPTRTLGRSWIGKVDVRFDVPLPAGQAVLFLAGGDGVLGVTGDPSTGLAVHTASFTKKATLHAIAYDASVGPSSASAYGQAEVISDAGTVKVVTFHLDPIAGERRSPTFELESIPPGFVPQSIEIRISASRSSDAVLVSIPWGTPASIAPIPNMLFSHELRATRADGAVSDSGQTVFDVASTKPNRLTLVAPPDVTGPEPGATIGAGEMVRASGPGVIEHVFEPTTAGAAALNIVLRNGLETPIPDASAVGVSTLNGTYTWTVRSYPSLAFVEAVWGPDGRRYRPFAVSAPRTIVLR